MIYIKIALVVIAIFGHANSQKPHSVYRDGYTLLPMGTIPPAFYKFHNDFKIWENAKETCEIDGAKLFYPETMEEINNTLWKDWMKTFDQNIENIHIGVSISKNSEEARTVDDKKFTLQYTHFDGERGKVSVCLLLNVKNNVMGSYHCTDFHTAFICKIPQAEVQWNNECNRAVVSRNGYYDYEYSSEMGKCYKLHTATKNWEDAQKICKDEKSYLAVLKSQDEANHLVELVSRVPEENVGVVCLGFRLKQRRWMTVNGVLLKDSGYAMWAHTQPDGGKDEKFGAMAYNGRLHDIAKDARCIFVCEHKIGHD